MEKEGEAVCKLSERNAYVGGIVTMVIYYVLFRYIVPIQYETNDDAVMMQLVSGRYSGHPSSYLVYINYYLSAALASLYELWPLGEWYPILMLGVNAAVVGVSFIISFDKRGGSYLSAAMRFMVMLSLVAMCTIRMQFTTTAAMSAAVGLWLIVLRTKVCARILGVVLLLLGALIRYQAAMLVVGVLLPVVSLWYARNKSNAASGLLVLGSLIAAVVLESACQSHYEKADPFYHNYTIMRSRILERPSSCVAVDKLPPSVSPNDYVMLNRFFSDPTAIDSVDLSKLAEGVQSKMDFSLGAGVRAVAKVLQRTDVLLCLLVLFLWIGSVDDKYYIYGAMLSGCVFLAAVGYLQLAAAVKGRVIYAAAMSMTMSYVALASTNQSRKRKLVVNALGVSVVAAFSLMAVARYSGNTVRHDLLQEQMKTIDLWGGDVVVYAASLVIEGEYLFARDAKLDGRVHYVGWMAGHPDQRLYKSHASLLQQDVAVLLGNKLLPGVSEQIASSIQESTGERPTWEIVIAGEKVSLVAFKRDSSLNRVGSRGY